MMCDKRSLMTRKVPVQPSDEGNPDEVDPWKSYNLYLRLREKSLEKWKEEYEKEQQREKGNLRLRLGARKKKEMN